MNNPNLSFYYNECERFESFLKNHHLHLESFHPYLEKAFFEMVLNGGKRFRPKLFLAVLCSLVGQKDYSNQQTEYFKIALSIECLHTYSLIHDDLPCMDNAALRRNHPTLHAKYDETTAVLIGDALNTYSFELLSNALLESHIIVELVKILSANGGIKGMILGQALDCYFENTPLNLEQLTFLHEHKTAKLISASLMMGLVASGIKDKELFKWLQAFGLKTGLCFQVLDDIIDVTQDEKESGKTTHLDSAKNSFVNLLGLEKASGYAQTLKTEVLNDLNLLKPAYPLLQENLNALLNTLFKGKT
ncbi:polyprenyl synthetase family protein [Helicobacter pylori]|uniref:polyprenyl synthetase family protein n=1 Tax=Helicobacter pylori TaxID=210 RepID=UPI00123814F3|nr:polyprenyl synthetase family protein [Helicobacter pylori]KAA6501004.1 polyprenyl synthetase family protein [Helicobacter pylori]KAA6518438.1 polyprenyl synthetase family protein [Helicobacter pylori]